MGFNSVVFICNDAIHEVEKDPKGWWQNTWNKLCTLAYGKTESFGYGRRSNGFEAVWNQHADITGVIMVGRNHATVIGSSMYGKHHTEEGQIQILKDILREKGYTIYKRKREQK